MLEGQDFLSLIKGRVLTFGSFWNRKEQATCEDVLLFQPPDLFLSGKSKRGLSKRGLGPKGANWAKKGLFGGNFCSSPVAMGCGGIGPDRPRKPKKTRFPRKDFPRFSLRILGLKPPFVSPQLDFPNFCFEWARKTHRVTSKILSEPQEGPLEGPFFCQFFG